MSNTKILLQHQQAQIDQIIRELTQGAKSESLGGWALGKYSISGSHRMMEAVSLLLSARKKLQDVVEVL